MPFLGKQPTSIPLTTSDLADDIVSLAKMAGGTDGNIITYDASGNPAVVATGTSGHFLKSQGSGSVPVFAAGAVNTPAFQARNSADQDIGYTGSFVKITANTELFDTDSKYDNSSNYRFTPTVAGKYYCYANAIFESTSSSNDGNNLVRVYLAIYKNGSAAAYSQINRGGQDYAFKQRSMQVITTLDMDDDDYIELYAMADSGVAGSTRVAADVTGTFFGAYKIIT